ncbi:hypothetical protein ATKI12_6569 [Kitasatospora sp. Ki12]
MRIRRTTALPVAALALALTAVTGCGPERSGPAPAAVGASTASAAAPATAATVSGAPTATAATTAAAASGAPADASGAFDPAVAMAHRSKEPYAATVEMTTRAGTGDEQVLITVTGRLNYNTPARGARTEGKTVAGGSLVVNWMETLTVDGVSYLRDKAKGETRWTREPGTGAGADADADRSAAYAELLLGAGPTARKGMETDGAVPVFHLAARLSADQVLRADPANAQQMRSKGVEAVDCHLWIDRFGRVVRGEQSMVVAGKAVVTKDHYTDFGPAETFAAPLTAN